MNPKFSQLSFYGRFTAIFLLLFFFGCRTVQPPTRPVANLFPTLLPMSRLPVLPLQTITASQVSELLATIGCLDLLVEAGMLPTELETLARGLSQRGYAEIDASRAGMPLRWLTLVRHDVNYWLITGSFQDYPPSACRQGLTRNEPPTGSKVTAAGASSETFWVQEKGSRRTELYQIGDAKAKKPRWQMIWALRDDGQ